MLTLKIKLIILAVMLAIGGGGVIYVKRVIAERNQLRADVVIYQENEAKLEQTIEDERTAARQAVSDRAETQRALDKLRRGRENDVESQEWAATPIPDGERQRLCEALPGAKGCQAE